MPNNITQPAVYLASGDPERESNARLQYPGQLGVRFTLIQPTRSVPGVEQGRSKTYQIVQTDSTMTVAPYKGAIALWSDKSRYLVTTNVTNRNRIAGVFQNEPAYPITLGHYTCVQVGGPGSVKIVDGSVGALAIGDHIIASSTNAKADRVAVGTAPTHATYGMVAGPPISVSAAEALVVVDLDVPMST